MVIALCVALVGIVTVNLPKQSNNSLMMVIGRYSFADKKEYVIPANMLM